MILWWIIFLSFLGNGGNKSVHSQVDSTGFISIDCGLSTNDSYIDGPTKLSYMSEAQLIDTGRNHNISREYITPFLSIQYLTVRSFNSGTRNCYSFKSLEPELKYLIRATFLYGNYDGLNKFTMFDLHIGVNFWKTINISDAKIPIIAEVITVAPADYVQVCLVNTGGGTPFISSLDLRPLKDSIYLLANSTQSLSLVKRLNAGPIDTAVIRYPDDQYDRMWEPWSNEPYWTELTTTSHISNLLIDPFEIPPAVMQTAVTPANSSVLKFDWGPDPFYKNPSYWFALHFSEIQFLDKNQSRWFNVTVDGMMWYDKSYSPPYLLTDALFGKSALQFPQYNVSLVATGNSTLPPLLNAFECFIVLPVANAPTDGGDVSTMNAIKAKYQIKKNWAGDPCAPKNYIWDGLICDYAPSSAPRITTLSLASSGLMGDFTPLFSELKALQSLNLSYNNLTGLIPYVLSQLVSLTLLDLTGNQLEGPIPDALLKKSQAGTLILRVEHNANVCYNATDCISNEQKKNNGSTRVVAIVVPVLVVLILIPVVVALLVCKFRKPKDKATGKVQYSDFSKDDFGDSLFQLENRQFTNKELMAITNGFSRILGKGGFGTVFHGLLEDGTEVAVKIQSESSPQGTRDFLSEAKILARVHHKFLVSMIGYCKDGSCVALVYEYMSGGTLQEHLQGNSAPLSWRQRIRIALESAKGLEYLHKGCNPPLIHRDVKTTNILLNTNLEAKVADFGLSKAVCLDTQTHITTCVVGTPGYLDPEYYMTCQLTEKSDVYSFGVVLLELITGQRVIIRAPMEGAKKTNIVFWVRQRLGTGNIESIVDARMQGDYDVNSVWKVADLALKCIMPHGSQRPTMHEVVAKLKECTELEVTGETENASSKYYTCQNSSNGTVRSGSHYTGNSSNGNTRNREYVILAGFQYIATQMGAEDITTLVVP